MFICWVVGSFFIRIPLKKTLLQTKKLGGRVVKEQRKDLLFHHCAKLIWILRGANRMAPLAAAGAET